MVCGVFSILLVGVSACTDKDSMVDLNPKLEMVLYWGTPTAGTNQFNVGPPTLHDIYFPVWTAADQFYVFTRHFNAGDITAGVFQIHVDPSTLDFASSTTYEFDRVVSNMVQDRGDGSLLVNTSDGGYKVSRLGFASGLTESLAVGPAWNPWGCSDWPGRRGVVFYGRHPETQVSGFYWIGAGSDTDSLLLAVEVSRIAARGLAVTSDGRKLLFATDDNPLRFFSFDLTIAGASPVQFAERSGGVPAISPHPVLPSRMLLTYTYPGGATRPPQSHIELFDLERMSSIDLDVRTEPSLNRFSTNDHPSWSPDGSAFLFSAGATSGEGEYIPFSIWLYRSPP